MNRPSIKTSRDSFSEAHSPDLHIRPPRKRKRKPPFSIRFSDAELEQLRLDAGDLTMAAYIRLRLFSEDNQPTRRRRTRCAPSLEIKMLAQILSALGQSQLLPSLSGLSEAAKTGALPVSNELNEELKAACCAIKDMRSQLIKTLCVKEQ